MEHEELDLTKPVNVEKYLAWREKDPEYHRRRRENAERLNEGRRSYRLHAGPVLIDLAAVGYPVDRIADLPSFYRRYPEAVPVLLDWLGRTDMAGIKEDIVRALTARWIGPDVGARLVDEFRKAPAEGTLRWAVGNALCETARQDVLDDLMDIAKDREYGRSRQMVVNGLGRFKRDEVEVVLIGLLDDDDVVGHAVYALGCLKREHLRAVFERLIDHHRVLVRREARNAIKKLNRRLKRV